MQEMAGRTEAVVHFFENLQRSELSRLGQIYAPQARFRDPFNEVQGVAQIEAIFQHMYRSLEQPHFYVTERVMQGRQCFLVWDFRFRFQRFSPAQWQTVHGSSHLRFDDQGLVEYHRDYWDAAQELYEKLPAVGSLMRWLRRQAMR
jgi:hypothetical protein